MNETEALKACYADGNIVFLPPAQLDRKTYQAVAKKLELIGGKWNRKAKGFLFQESPAELLLQIQNGDKRNLKKEYQFFASPPELAAELVELANLAPHHSILEPSAGQGAIIKAIHDVVPDTVVDCYEAMSVNRQFLSRMPNVRILGKDFLTSPLTRYARIIANPPFSKNQDIAHVRAMWERLEEGGRLVTVASCHWQDSSRKKESAFREWLEEIGARYREVEAGTFADSGTEVPAVILIMDSQPFKW